MQLLGCEFREGRAGSAPALRTEGGVTSFEVDEDGTAYMVQGALESGSPSGNTAALLIQQRACYVTAHCERDTDEGVPTCAAPDHKVIVSGRSKSSSELAQKMPEGTQKMPEGTQKMPVGTFSKSGTGCRTSISAPRWADLDSEGTMSKAEVLKLLAVLGLPHLRDTEGRKQCIFEAWPELNEAQDFLVEHGLGIGRKHSGTRALLSRLGPHTADPICRGALSSEVHAPSVAHRIRVVRTLLSNVTFGPKQKFDQRFC